jgi:hypothetical protein
VRDTAKVPGAVPRSIGRRSRYTTKAKRDKSLAQIEGARKTDDFPGFIDTCDPPLVAKTPGGARWLHELNVGRYRCQLHLWHGGVSAYTRRQPSGFARRVDRGSGKAPEVKEAIPIRRNSW